VISQWAQTWPACGAGTIPWIGYRHAIWDIPAGIAPESGTETGGKNMSMQFVWQDEYRVGDAQLDQQHQHLFELGNRILAATDFDAALQSCLVELYAHTRTHFQAEEAKMREHGDPRFEAHRDQHDQLLTRLTELSAQLHSEPQALAVLKTFIAEWVMGHIVQQDLQHRTLSGSRLGSGS
jgi:hemerythrin